MSRSRHRIPLTVALVAAAAAAWFAMHDDREPAREPPPADAPTVTADGFPRLELGERRVSFGSRYDDEETVVSIPLRNVGARTLHIERIDTNCGCFRVGEAPKQIEPGQSAALELKVRLAGLDGPLERVVAIHTDDPKALAAHVSVVGEVRPRLAIQPATIELRPKSAASAGELDVSVRSTDGVDIAGMAATSLTPGLTVETTFAKGQAFLRVVAAPFVEDFTGSIVLRRGEYERILAVTGIAYADVRVAPARLEAGVIRAATTVEGKLVGAPGVDWRVASVTCNRADFTAEVKDGLVRATIGDAAPAGLFAGLVIIDLDGAKPSRLLVPVTAYVER